MTTVFIISAPSGSGKSTLVSRLLASDPGLRFSVSYTTRKPRGNEKPGESYVYITPEDFRKRVDRGEFLEHAEVFGNYYGTHSEVLEQAQAEGKDLILDIDVKGARQLSERIPEAVTIFILPPSRDILEQRLRSRSEDSEAVIQRRLQEAGEELRNYKQYEYVLVNHQVEESTATLAAIIKAERVRRTRMEEQIRPILKSFEDRSTSFLYRAEPEGRRLMEKSMADKPRPNAMHSIPEDENASTYRFIIVAAKRARQLQNGQRSVLPAANKKPTTLAMEETRRGLVPFTDLTLEEQQIPAE